MLRKAFCAMSLVFLALLPAMAQDVPKVEVFGGYSWAGGNFHGWNASVTGNVTKRLGVVGDFSGQRVTPFVYALFGATRFQESAIIGGQKLSGSDTGFSSALGGGLDVKVNDRLAIRAFQIDYFRPNFFGEAHNRGRLAFGLVLRLGKK
jgi:opacity protein-like surface antigen